MVKLPQGLLSIAGLYQLGVTARGQYKSEQTMSEYLMLCPLVDNHGKDHSFDIVFIIS